MCKGPRPYLKYILSFSTVHDCTVDVSSFCRTRYLFTKELEVTRFV